jgi:protocatechuate 3,4-dioxygenase beta subunit
MQMKWKLFIVALVASVLFPSDFYLGDRPTVMPGNSSSALSLESDQVSDLPGKVDDLPGHEANTVRSPATLRSESVVPVSDTPSTTQRFLNIYGTIVDDNNQPIENALISEEFRFHSTRSDSDGRYQISVKLASFKNPVVNIMRTGYREERVWVEGDDLQDGETVKIDVSLAEAFDTTSIHGWIGNHNGEGIAAQKVRITSHGGLGLGNILYVVSSDERGDFSFEGVRSGLTYRLEVLPSAQYLRYLDDFVEVSHNTPFLNITLKSINLVDVSGMLVSSAGVPVPDFKINVRNTTTNSLVRMVTSDSSGFFKLERFPAGEVQFSTTSPEYFKISGVTLSPNETRNLNLVIDKGIYYLSGWVSDPNGVPVENARVTVDAEIESGIAQSISYRSRITNRTGSFSFADLGNETHMITVYTKDFERKEIIHQFVSSSEQIHIILSLK